MSRVFLADAHPEESSALRLLLGDLNLTVVGESTDWASTVSRAPATIPDLLLVDAGLLPIEPTKALFDLGKACPNAKVVALVGSLDPSRQRTLFAVADLLIDRDASPEQVAECLLEVAKHSRS